MTILLTGSDGQLAWDIQQLAKESNIELIALPITELDITQASDIEQAITTYQPSIIINPAAFTMVDLAEKERELAYLVNETGPQLLASACSQAKIPLIHFSTDYVFDGTSKKPYTEEDNTNPLSVYGKSKFLGEKHVRKLLDKHIILRTSGVFGFHGHNFIKTMIKFSSERETLKIVDDQITCPTPAKHLAQAVFTIAKKIQNGNCEWGTYHYCGLEPATWFDFAKQTIQFASQYKTLAIKNLETTTSTEFNAPAARPAFSVLDCSKIKSTFGIHQESWKTELSNIIESLLK